MTNPHRPANAVRGRFTPNRRVTRQGVRMPKNRKRLPLTLATNKLEKWVVRWVNSRTSDYDSGVAGVIADAEHGCASGVVGELIYSRDCRKFARRFLTEILSALDDYTEETGQSLVPDRKRGQYWDETWLAWVGFELALSRVTCRMDD